MVVGQVQWSRKQNADFWHGSRSEVPRYPRCTSDLEVLWTKKKKHLCAAGVPCQRQLWLGPFPFYLIALRPQPSFVVIKDSTPLFSLLCLLYIDLLVAHGIP